MVIALLPLDIRAYYKTRLPKLSQRNQEWRGPCPIHGGKRDSLAVDAETGRAYCHSSCGQGWDIPGFEQALSGCDFPTAVQRVSEIVGRDLSSNGTQPERRTICEHDYCDADGKLLFQVVRFDPKDFRQRRPDGDGGWVWKMRGVQLVPYRLSAVLKSEIIYIVEGEKDVHSLENIGIIATTNAGGAGKWRREYREYFQDKEVYLIPDADEPGRKHAQSVATSLKGVAASVSVISLPTGKDVSDWIGAGGTAEQLRELAAAAPEYVPAPPEPTGIASPSQHLRAADLDGFRFTDLATAELMVKWYGRELHYSHAWHKWLVWDGKRWKVDDTGAVVRRAADTVRLLYDVAGTIKESKERERLVRHALSYEAKKKRDAMIALAASQLDIVVLPDQLDRDKWLLNVNNGTLDLRTGELREHRRECLITKLAPVPFDPEAKAPLFEKFLDDIFAGNQDVIRFVQRAIGYAITGDTSEQCLFITWGGGENGKSTLIETILALAGDYGTFTPPETLIAKRHDGIPNDLARLKGARFVAAVETEEGKHLAEARIKQMTGGDTISARFMRGEWFDFTPEFKCFLATNHKPGIRGTDHAIWRRIRLVPFTVRIPADKQDKHLAEKLLRELPGILNFAVQGCLDWQRDGLRPPVEVTSATAEYRDENDQVGRFVGEGCGTGEYLQVKARPLYQEYRRWATEAGEKDLLTETAFAQRLAEKGFAKKHTNSGTIYFGIGLKKVTADGL